MTKEELDEFRQKLALLEKESDAAGKEVKPYIRKINRLDDRVWNLRSKIADEIRRNAAGKIYLNDYFRPPNLYYYAIDSVDKYKKWTGTQAVILFEEDPQHRDINHTRVYANEYEKQKLHSNADVLKLREVTREEFEKVLQLVDYYENLSKQLDKDIDDKMKELGLKK